MNKFIQKTVKYLQTFIDRVWYGPLIGLLALVDNIILVIPNDGILISSSMLVPKKWLRFALFISIGSTIGAVVLAAMVEWYGVPFLQDYFPQIANSRSFQITEAFFNDYGLWVVFFVAIMPLIQQPAVVLAALAETPLWQLAVVVFIGRVVKFLLMSWVASHAPNYLAKMWGVSGELEEVGVKLKKDA